MSELDLSSARLVEGLDRALAWHDELRATVTRLERAFSEGAITPRLGAPWRHFVEGMEDHMRVEEEILFPAIRALAEGRDPGAGDFEGPLHEMQFEVDELATLCDALRAAAPEAGAHEAALLDMLDALDVHADREQNALFPAADRLFRAWKATEAPAPTPVRAPAPTPPASAPAASAPSPHGVLFRVLRRLRERLG